MVSHYGGPADHGRASSHRASRSDARTSAWERLANRYLRLTEVVVRGPVGVAVAIGVFVAADVISSTVSGRVGVAVASVWVLLSGIYCLLNFLRCRETHCVITGAGWIPLGLLGLVAVLMPGTTLSWYRVGVAAVAYLVILAAGYGLQAVVAARTGRRTLGAGRDGAGRGRAQAC